MTPKEISLVQNSWQLLRHLDPNAIGDLFYSKLFFEHPELRPMFPQNMLEQHHKLIGKFNMVIARLHNLSELTEDIAALGRRHVGYGVEAIHYGYVGAALLWTLERGLGSDWTPEVAAAWQKCFGVLSSAMMAVAEPA